MMITSLPQLHRFLKTLPPSSEILPKLLVTIEDTSFTTELFGHFMDRMSHLPESIHQIHLTLNNFHFMLGEPKPQHFESLNKLHFGIKELTFDLPRFEYLYDCKIVESLLDLAADQRRENSLEAFKINIPEQFELELNKKQQLFRFVAYNTPYLNGVVYAKIIKLLQSNQYQLQVLKIKLGKKNINMAYWNQINEVTEEFKLLLAANKISTNLRVLSLEVFYFLNNNALDQLQKSIVNQKNNNLVSVNIYIRNLLQITHIMRLVKGLGENIHYGNIVFEENSNNVLMATISNMQLQFTLKYNPQRNTNRDIYCNNFGQALSSWQLHELESFTFVCESKYQSLIMCRQILDSFQYSLGKLKQCRISFNSDSSDPSETIPIKSLRTLILANKQSLEILEIKVNQKCQVDGQFYRDFFRTISELSCLQNLVIDFGKVLQNENSFFTVASQLLVGITQNLEVLELISPNKDANLNFDVFQVTSMAPIVASHVRLRKVNCVQQSAFLSLESEQLKGNLHLNSTSNLSKLFESFNQNEMVNEALKEIDFVFNIENESSINNMDKILERISSNILKITTQIKSPPSLFFQTFGIELKSFRGFFSLKHNDIQKILSQDNILSLEFCNDDVKSIENQASEEDEDSLNEKQDSDEKKNENDENLNNKEQKSGDIIQTTNDQQIQLPVVINIESENNKNDESSVWSSSNDNNNNDDPDEIPQEKQPKKQSKINTELKLKDLKKIGKEKKKKTNNQFPILNSLITQEFSQLCCNLSLISNKILMQSLISSLNLCPSHILLNFSQCWLRDVDMKYFKDIFINLPTHMQSIQLDLSQNPLIHNKGSIQLFKKLNKHSQELQSLNLNLSRTSIKTKGILALAKKIIKLKALRELTLNISSSSSMNRLDSATIGELFQAVLSLKNLKEFVLQAADDQLSISQKFFDQLGDMLMKLPANMVGLHFDFSLNQMQHCDIKKVQESLPKLPITLELFYLNLECLVTFNHSFLLDLISIGLELCKLPRIQSLSLILPTFFTVNSDLTQILTAYQTLLVVLLNKNFKNLIFSVAGIKLTIESNTLFFSMADFLQSAGSLTKSQLNAEAFTFYQIFLTHKRCDIKYAPNLSFFPAVDIKKYEIGDTILVENSSSNLNQQHREDIQQIEEEDESHLF